LYEKIGRWSGNILLTAVKRKAMARQALPERELLNGPDSVDADGY
jgi:hypothetical protein